MLLSIIIPIYNVEQYIRPCIESVFNQGLNDSDYEVILVNDGIKDNSLGMIEDIIASHQNITIEEQTHQGPSVARNAALRIAKGQYILFIDSDDLLLSNSIGCLLQEASNSNADLVIADFIKMTNDEINNTAFCSPKEQPTTFLKTGHDIFLHEFDPRQCYVWRTLYKKSFLDDNQLRFIPNIYFEDVPFTIECYLKAKTCVKVSQQFYIYRQRENSIVSSINMKKLKDINEVVAQLWKMKETMQLSEELKKQLMNAIFTTFSIAIWYITHNKDILEKRREFVDDLKGRVPRLKFTNSMKQKAVSFCFNTFPCTYIKLRSRGLRPK